MNQLQRAIRLANISLFTFGALAAVPALAQESKGEESAKLEEVEVTGYRGSVKKSLNIKRNADVMVDAISAEDVGKFPDQTVADALQRVAGVSVEKSEGEADRVSIRGTAPHLNLTLFNGQHVATAEASASVLNPPSRSFNYSLLPSELIDTLEVHKSAQAKIEEGSVGGTVIIKTRSPLQTEANHVAFSLKNIYQESSGENSPSISGFYNWKNTENTLGFNLGYVRRDNRIQRDTQGMGYLGYQPVNDADGNVDYYLPNNVRATRFRSEKDLSTVTANFEWQASDQLNLELTNLFSKVDRVNQSISNGIRTLGAAAGAGIINPVMENGVVVAGSLSADGNNGRELEESWYSTNNNDGGYETRAHNLELNFAGDGYTLSAQLGTTQAKGDILDDQIEFEASTDASFDVRGEPSYAFAGNLSPSDYATMYTHRNIFDNSEKEDYVQLDLNIELNNTFFSSVDVGAKYRDHLKDSNLHKDVWVVFLDPYITTLDNYADGSVAGDFKGGSSSQQGLYEFEYANWVDWTNATPTYRSNYRPDYSFELKEQIASFYVQGNIEYDRLHGNVGLRYAKTDSTSEGFQLFKPVSWNPDTWTMTPASIDNDYKNVLPSLNLAYDLREDTVLRFAAAKVLSRPDYDNLKMTRGFANSIWVPGYDGFGSGGNPNLKPYRATQYDLATEYYFTDSSILSVAYFYKDIDTYIETADVGEDLIGEDGPGYYRITIPVNGLGGVNQGLEVNLQHDFNNGFGVLANYTYSDADMKESEEDIAAGIEKQLPANSRDTYNLTAYYEDHGLSARLAYNYRSKYYTGTSRNGLDLYRQGYGQLDANVSYRLTDNIDLVVNLLNLTDAEQSSEWGEQGFVGDVHQYGRRIFAGVSAKF
ncbi:TonB-dependent receptor [Microbulbifer hydrolyticus]|uniref:Iron complex outermembrane receptor protein n=1 Tax=Microbulbifer hydrolyticus TaxID=48074 RepID=A0A6P1TBD5_9GAMM|nr:TonB-dependent receptor [Microbulbifer hydrolyticus]MBB5211272.1 iron complex outermembrane receptor protein [Microbulbifer hydrolyticus]QHQ37962.1 TonB-dependent receptor [Microbulbifer hydrolyticus]